MLQLTFSTTSVDIVLGSIEVKADEAMSGAFTIENGQAKVSQPEGDKPGIILDLGDEGVKIGVTAKKFNMAVPAGEYNNLTITFIAKDGQKCTIHATKAQNLIFNTVNTLAISGEFKSDFPAGALPGKFSVEEGKQVLFSKGNLFYDGSKFNFETNQCDSQSSWNTSHVSHFYWSKDKSVACANSYIDDSAADTDVFFTNDPDDATKPNVNFTVNVGGTEQSGWRTLSTNEWKYLFNTRTVNGGQGAGKSYSLNITYCGKMGLVLYPDDYDKDPVSGLVTDLPDGVVFLPAAGLRGKSYIYYVDNSGSYWSSSTYDENGACSVYFSSSVGVHPDDGGYRYDGFSVRLITESK